MSPCIMLVLMLAGEVKVGIFALRDIPVGEELSYDYQFQHYGLAQAAGDYRSSPFLIAGVCCALSRLVGMIEHVRVAAACWQQLRCQAHSEWLRALSPCCTAADVFMSQAFASVMVASSHALPCGESKCSNREGSYVVSTFCADVMCKKECVMLHV